MNSRTGFEYVLRANAYNIVIGFIMIFDQRVYHEIKAKTNEQ